MPIGFSSKDTLWVRLDSLDKGKPEAERARFKVRHLSSGQVRQVEQLVNEAAKCSGAAERDEKLNAAILVGIVGWENLRDGDGNLIPFSPEGLSIFSDYEKLWAATEYPSQVFFAEGDLKNSASRLPPKTENSTPGVAPATASAATAQA